jgi:hypothetical protein
MKDRDLTEINREVRAKEKLAKNPTPVLTEEFAGRVNVVVGEMPDSMQLATLFAPWDKKISDLANNENIQYEEPPLVWEDFMESIGSQEYIQLKKLARAVYGRYLKCRTLGDIRNLSLDEQWRYYRIGERGLSFTTLAFKKQENQELTLGL